LWRTILHEFDLLLSTLTDLDTKNAVSMALQSLRLTSGFAMDSIWAEQKPYFDGEQRVRGLLQELQSEYPATKQSGNLSDWLIWNKG
jgi:hypothetical protein